MSSKSRPFFKVSDFREILLTELEQRQRRRPEYSARAFARDLGVKQATFHDILSGRHGPSVRAAHSLATKLKLSEEQTVHFIDLVRAKHARSKAERDRAQERVKKRISEHELEPANDAMLSVLRKWYYPAILELVTIKKGQINEAIVAEILGITLSSARIGLQELCDVGTLVYKDGKYTRLKSYLRADRPTPSHLIRDFHKQVMSKAIEAIETQAIEERKFLSSVLSIKKSNIQFLRKRLEELHNEFASSVDADKDADTVYVFATQLFDATSRKQN